MKMICFKQRIRLLYSISLFLLITACQLKKESEPVIYSIVYSSKEVNGRGIFLSDENGKSRKRITSFTADDGYPAVSFDGKKIAFYGKYDNRKTWSIHIVNIDGSGVKRLTHVKNKWDSSPSWSPSGKTIVFAREYADEKKGWQEEIWLMNEDGSEQRKIANVDGSNLVRLTNNKANDWSPKISPDGTQIVFLSNRDGNQEIYTMSIDGSNQKRLTFNQLEDWGPAWSSDGSKIFFHSEKFDVYKMNKDGSSLVKILSNGLQVATINK